VSRHTRIRVYKTLARPVLSYGSEAWTIRTDERRSISAEMRFLSRTAGYTLYPDVRWKIFHRKFSAIFFQKIFRFLKSLLNISFFNLFLLALGLRGYTY
jgi:hypothetical protein